MPHLNKVIIMGHMGKDPEIRYTSNGKAVCDFSVGVSDRKDKTEWFNVTLWEKSAEFAGEHAKKGDPVFVEGRQETQKWQDKEGNDRYTVKLIGHSFQILRKVERTEKQRDQADRNAADRPDDFEDDIPW